MTQPCIETLSSIMYTNYTFHGIHNTRATTQIHVLPAQKKAVPYLFVQRPRLLGLLRARAAPPPVTKNGKRDPSTSTNASGAAARAGNEYEEETEAGADAGRDGAPAAAAAAVPRSAHHARLLSGRGDGAEGAGVGGVPATPCGMEKTPAEGGGGDGEAATKGLAGAKGSCTGPGPACRGLRQGCVLTSGSAGTMRREITKKAPFSDTESRSRTMERTSFPCLSQVCGGAMTGGCRGVRQNQRHTPAVHTMTQNKRTMVWYTACAMRAGSWK